MGSEYAPPAEPQNPLERPVAALLRYKWIIAAITIVSGALGVFASRMITPEYEVRATVWIENTRQPGAERMGPIRSAELLSSGAWIELFRSYRVVDEVVRKLALYVIPGDMTDRSMFRGFSLSERFAPGGYELTIDRSAKRWSLATSAGTEVDRGAATDSVGRRVGFQWLLAPSAFQGEGAKTVPFVVVTPREKSMELIGSIGTRLAQNSNFLWLTYQHPDPWLAARTLNTWLAEYLRVASDLKQGNVVEYAKILESQLRFAERATQDAEVAYQQFRVNTIILPTEGGPVAAQGVEDERDPALVSYFDQKIEYDNLRHDREALEKNIASAAEGKSPYEGLLFIPSVAQSPGAEALREAFRNQYTLQADLRVKRQTFTDQHPAVAEVTGALDVLQKQTIPQLANQLLQQLKERENDYQRRIQAASRELRDIPPRTIEERRLSRAVVVAEGLYTNLKARYAEAKLAEASARPDVSVLDTAIAPLSPTKNTAMMVILLGIVGGLGAAVGLALLLDRLDGKIRYSTQVISDLGLVIAGAVPRIPKGGIDSRSPEQVMQFVESFRTLRMHALHSGGGRRVSLAITSAAPGDGKSLVSANLALSFAEAGFRTVLVDGDTRRGSLHRMHGLDASPGLTEYLVNGDSEGRVIRATSHPNLSLVSCGARHPRSPELLTSAHLKTLVEKLAQSFDVVIFDTPPLAAGIDAYAITAAVGRAMIVVRLGATERRLAAAKLATLDRLPVAIDGAVLNAVPTSGEFQYYSYAPGYLIDTTDEVGALAESSTK